jgi:hypothetical protein
MRFIWVWGVFCCCCCCFAVLGFELKAYTLSHFTSPFFVMSIFEIGSCELFPRGWIQTSILLTSASSVARITSVSQWCLAWCLSLSCMRETEDKARDLTCDFSLNSETSKHNTLKGELNPP